MKRALQLLVPCLLLFVIESASAQTPNAWINELHYDNAGGDTNEFVEVIIQDAGSYMPGNIQVLHYNGADGDPDAAAPVTLDEFASNSLSGGFTLYSYDYTANGETLQNSTEALALCFDSDEDGTFETLIASGGVDQLLSYEGELTASGGCADGLSSTDIGVNESSSTSSSQSLQLTGTGGSYSDFSWTGPTAASPGSVNAGQTLGVSSGPVENITQSTFHPTIQDAVDNAAAGDAILISAGTYEENVDIPLDGLTLTGESETGVVLNVPDENDRGIFIAADNVTLRQMTINGPGNDYGIKAQGESTLPSDDGDPEDRATGLTLRDLTVQGSGRSEVDLNGVDDAMLEDLTLNGQGTPGNALAATDSDNIQIANVTTDGQNAWGGIALYAGSTFFTPGVSDVSISGSVPSEGIYKQVKGGFEVSNLALPSAFQHALRNSTFRGTPSSPADSDQFTFYVTDETSAIQAALSLNNSDDSYVQTLTRDGSDHVSLENNFVVGTDGSAAMSIQAAVGASESGGTINVLAGTYAENVLIDKSVALQTGVASTLAGSVEVSAGDVAVDGFEILGGPTSANPSATVGIYVRSGTSGHALSSNILSGPGSGGQVRGILLGSGGVTNTTISGNSISGWTSGIYLNPGASGVTISGNTIQNNTAGIGSDGISDVTITGNLFADNGEGFGASATGAGVSATSNCFIDNAVGVKNYGGETIDATNNWWGQAAGPTTTDTDGDVDVDPFATEPIGGIEGCSGTGGGGTCPTPTVAGETQTEQALEVTFSSGGDGAGITQVNFTDPSDTPALTNFEVDTDQLPGGFTADGAENIRFSFAGSEAPSQATFVLTAVPPDGATDTFEASYFAIIENTCGATFEADPIHRIDRPIPETLTLSSNYPNPFSGRTTITLALPEQMKVDLAIYDVMGRQVAILNRGRMPAGTHQVRWTGRAEGGRQLASGVYLLRLKAGDQVRTRRLTIVR